VVDHRHLRLIAAADRGFRLDCCCVALGDLPIERNRQVGLDYQFAQARDGKDMGLLVDVFSPDSARSATTPSSGLRIVLSSRAASARARSRAFNSSSLFSFST
jgi:hypothetical protein